MSVRVGVSDCMSVGVQVMVDGRVDGVPLRSRPPPATTLTPPRTPEPWHQRLTNAAPSHAL